MGNNSFFADFPKLFFFCFFLFLINFFLFCWFLFFFLMTSSEEGGRGEICPVCYEKYYGEDVNVPLVLQCGHSLCGSCGRFFF